jgi:hypothetical protein
VQTTRLLQLQDGARYGNTERRAWNRRRTGTWNREASTWNGEARTCGLGNRDLRTDRFPGAYQTLEAGIGIMELRIKILGRGNMVPGTQKNFPRTRNVDPGNKVYEIVVSGK